LRLESVPAAPLYGVSGASRVRALGRLLAGVRAARTVLRQRRIELVLGFGGYASAGVVLAARSLGLCTAIHEANATLGLTNRLLARVVDRVCLGDAHAGPRFRTARLVLTGTPLRPAVAALAAEPRQAPAPGQLRLLVCGGSQGSPFLNRHAAELAQALAACGLTVSVRHQCGREDPAAVSAAYAALGLDAAVCAHLDDMPAAYRWADLAVSCAGAATLAELAVAGLPALLVPLASAAEDHQSDNAAAYAAATGTAWVREAAWDAPALAAPLAQQLRDPAAWRAQQERVRAHARPDAAAAVVAACEALLATGG
jgi:UDP-N-acetylglucosamine--N-acetylmuramyl-(pentapeptide) pyrophosphoryl-undecaprenol N-acetylglucosamine transferase